MSRCIQLALVLSLAAGDERARLDEVMREDRAALRDEYLASARDGAGRALGGSIARADLEAIYARARWSTPGTG